jgi:hypothetical protein
MTWKKKRTVYGKYEHYSLSKKLKRDNKISEQFEIMLNSLTLEELIALKLDLANKAAGSPIYGFPIMKQLKHVVKAAVLMYAASATRTEREAAAFLGITRLEYREYIRDYNILGYFDDERKLVK